VQNGWLVNDASLDGFNDAALNLPTISGAQLIAAQRGAMKLWGEHRKKRPAAL